MGVIATEQSAEATSRNFFFHNTSFARNSATNGAVMVDFFSVPRMANCMFDSNIALVYGGVLQVGMKFNDVRAQIEFIFDSKHIACRALFLIVPCGTTLLWLLEAACLLLFLVASMQLFLFVRIAIFRWAQRRPQPTTHPMEPPPVCT